MTVCIATLIYVLALLRILVALNCRLSVKVQEHQPELLFGPLQVPREVLREVLPPLSTKRASGSEWEFALPTDSTFLAAHRSVEKQQRAKWRDAEAAMTSNALSLRISSMEEVGLVHLPSTSGVDPDEEPALGDPMRVDRGVKGGLSYNVTAELVGHRGSGGGPGAKGIGVHGQEVVPGGPGRGSLTMNGYVAGKEMSRPEGGWQGGAAKGGPVMSEATRAALPGALRDIFVRHHVLT